MSTTAAEIPRFARVARSVRVSRLLLSTIWVMYRERPRVIRAHAKGEVDVGPNIEALVKVLVQFRETAIKLGGLLIKLGQFLSARADLLPEEALAVLASLQDEVPAEPFSHVVTVIEEELGKPIDHLFSSIVTAATAAASLGQVHKAVLVSSGEEVVAVTLRQGMNPHGFFCLSSVRERRRTEAWLRLIVSRSGGGKARKHNLHSDTLFPGRCQARSGFHAWRKGMNGPQLTLGILGRRNTRLFRGYLWE